MSPDTAPRPHVHADTVRDLLHAGDARRARSHGAGAAATALEYALEACEAYRRAAERALAGLVELTASMPVRRVTPLVRTVPAGPPTDDAILAEPRARSASSPPPEHERRITRNRIRCNACGGEPESTHVHHMAWCGCGQCAADGGTDYLKRAFGKPGYEELAEYEDAADDAERAAERLQRRAP